MIDKARGDVWLIEAIDSELDAIKEKYPVISTVPAEGGWEVQIVADKLEDFPGKQIDPNLEHAYVYFMEYEVGKAWNGEFN